jgi:hypothetical protein
VFFDAMDKEGDARLERSDFESDKRWGATGSGDCSDSSNNGSGSDRNAIVLGVDVVATESPMGQQQHPTWDDPTMNNMTTTTTTTTTTNSKKTTAAAAAGGGGGEKKDGESEGERRQRREFEEWNDSVAVSPEQRALDESNAKRIAFRDCSLVEGVCAFFFEPRRAMGACE